MNLAFMAAAAVVLLCALEGYKRGLVKSVISTVGLVAAILLTNVLSPYMHDFLCNHTSLQTDIRQRVETGLGADKLDDGSTVYQQEEFLESADIPEIVKNYIRSGASALRESADTTVQSYVDYVVEYLTDMVVNGIAFILTFILLRLIIFIALALADILRGIPVIRGLDRMGGILFGIARAVLVIWCAMLAVTLLSVFPWAAQILNLINDSSVMEYLYDKNIFLNILNGVLSSI